MVAKDKNEGCLEVADFVDVIRYNKSLYPEGVKKFTVAPPKEEEIEEVEETKE